MMKKSAVSAILLSLGVVSSHAATKIKYMLWDPNQQPVYQQCANDFEKLNPNIKIDIQRADWEDYWAAVNDGMKKGTPPDVFANHLSRSAVFIRAGNLLNIQPLIDRDKVPTGNFMPTLFKNWGRDGKQYGMPKDWDTVALVVNLDRAKEAGVSLEQLRSMKWNPKDGGTFEQIAAKLTRDSKGHSGATAGFDPAAVTMYGYQTPQAGGMLGQTEWSHFAVSAGYKFQNQPWDDSLKYDDPHLADTLTWLESLMRKGLAPRLPQGAKVVGSNDLFLEGKVAMVAMGSWGISEIHSKAKKFKFTWVPMPTGPTGERYSMFNGLADSIAAKSAHPEEAWKWVKYLGSTQCQSIVAKSGVVFPAMASLFTKTLYAHSQKGLDTSAFLNMALGKVFPPPMTDNGDPINAVMDETVQDILNGKVEARAGLKAADAKIKTALASASTPKQK